MLFIFTDSLSSFCGSSLMSLVKRGVEVLGPYQAGIVRCCCYCCAVQRCLINVQENIRFVTAY